ncbi:MAG: MBL fold metallo-hydrolase [Kiritimatiellia bacterium]
MALKILFTGTGTSVGIPMIGCHCPVCSSSDPRNTRSRSSVYLKTSDTALIIDTPPDFRQQMLTYRIEHLDAVVFTHAHADHFLGFDDIRRFNTLKGGAIPAYADPETMTEIQRVFNYIDSKPSSEGLYRPVVEFHDVSSVFSVGDIKLTPVEVQHGHRMTGYRIDCKDVSAGYVPDCCGISQESINTFKGVDVMILDGLRYRPHPSHFSIEQSCEVLEKIGAERSLLTHICHDVDHAELSRSLPSHIQPAYDGLEITL